MNNGHSGVWSRSSVVIFLQPALLLFWALVVGHADAWTTTTTSGGAATQQQQSSRCAVAATRVYSQLVPQQQSLLEQHQSDDGNNEATQNPSRPSRRQAVHQAASVVAAISSSAFLFEGGALPAMAAPATQSSSTDAAVITEKVYITIRGLPPPPLSSNNNNEKSTSTTERKIIIGLFGKDAPQSVNMLKQLLSQSPIGGGGLPAPCRPRAQRSLQKEQLEANKVYASCVEQEERGVTLVDSTVWRVRRNQRIDVGAVKGRFVAREYPNWQEEEQDNELTFRHDTPGIVSVRRGNEGGFGFTIYPGDISSSNNDDNEIDRNKLDKDHIIVGRVIQGLDVIQAMNDIPVIATSGAFNYMSLTGGPKTNNAPDRSCRYGGPMYCNENKPLVKLVVAGCGVL